MKKLLPAVLTIAIGFASLNLVAQTAVGIRGGVNFAGVYPPDEISGASSFIEDITSFNVALITEFELGNNLSFQPELAYVRKGFKIQQGIDINLLNVPLPVGLKAVTTFDYLEVPLLLKYHFGDNLIKAHLFGGPTMGYALSGKLKTKARLLFEIPVSETNLDLASLDYQRFEVGATVGAGVSVPAGPGNLFLDARYTHGFTQLYDVPLIDLKVKNKSIGINLGYMIPLH